MQEPLRRRCELPERGVALAMLDWGGDGPLALLHHANGFCAATLVSVALGLRAHYRVVAFDARGHGRSSKPAGADAYRWPEFGRDLAALAAALAPEAGPVALAVGHSFGGTATLLAGAEHPGLFARAVLIDPVAFPRAAYESDAERRARAGGMAERARRRRHEFADRAAARAHWQGRELFEGWDPRAFDGYLDGALLDRPDGSVELACTGAVESAVFENGGSVDAFAESRRFTAPALVLWAERGNFPLAHFEALVRGMPDARLRRVDGGHLVPMQAPQLVVREILAFSVRPDDRAVASP